MTAAAPRKVVVGDAVLWLGDAREILPQLPDRYDAVITDPPYGTGCAPRGGDAPGTIAFANVPLIEWDIFDLSWAACVAPQAAAAVFCHHKAIADVAMVISADATFAYVKSNPSPLGTSWEAIVARGFARTAPQHIVAYNAFNGQQHPTQKPLEVMEFVAQKAPYGTVLDPFMGSGTTGVACARLGRGFVGIEIDPAYHAIAVRRITEAHRQRDLFHHAPPRAARCAAGPAGRVGAMTAPRRVEIGDAVLWLATGWCGVHWPAVAVRDAA